ncbi:MAG: DMT family transporter [Pseudomonadota bacterium]
MSVFDWFRLTVLSILWGGSFFFVEVLLEHWPPLTIVALRVSIAALVLWPIVLAKRIDLPRTVSGWGALAVMGMINNAIPFSLIVWGQSAITGGLASILNATTPVFTVVVAGLLLTDERFTVGKVVGVLLGLLGVVAMIGVDALVTMGDAVLAQLAVVGASVSYAFAATFGRRFARLGVPALLVAAGQVTASALLLIPLALSIEAPLSIPMPGIETWLAIIGLAVFSTAFAYQLYFALLATAGATYTSLVTILVPVSAILLGWVFLGEQLEREHLIGMAIIGIALLVIDGRWTSRRRRAA